MLKDIDLTIEPGELFAFLGPSGCGKTTLLRLIAGFCEATSGDVRLGATSLLGLPPWKRDVGMVFQSYALWPHLTVARNVAFGLEERRLSKGDIETRVKAALDLVGLAHLANRYPAQLSGGQQQRVAVARTIAIEPKLLLLDEPLSNLDAKMRLQVRRELRELQKRLGITTIFVTHDQEEANSICDRIAVFNEGVVQQVGSPIELYERPANLFVASFLGTANLLTGRVVSATNAAIFETSSGGRLLLPPDTMPGPATLMFRPQHARLGPPTGGLKATVASREFLGASVRYELLLDGATVRVDVPFTASCDLLPTGVTTGVNLDMGRGAIFR